MDKKNKSDYWKEFSPIWCEEIKSWLGWEGWRRVMTKIILYIIPLMAILEITGNIVKIIDEATTKIIGLAVLIVWAFVISIISYWKSNVILYDKQKGIQKNQTRKISKLQGMINIKKVRTRKITISPNTEPAFNDKEYCYAYLDAQNGEESDLRNCFAHLEILQIRDSDNDEWVDWLDWWIKGNTTELTWPAFNNENEKKIRRTKSARINVAKMSIDGFPLFIFADGKEEPVPAGQVYIEVSLNGELNKNGKLTSIEEIIFRGFIKKYKGYYVQEGATVTQTINGVPQIKKEPPENIPEFRLWIEPGELNVEKEDQKNKKDSP